MSSVVLSVLPNPWIRQKRCRQTAKTFRLSVHRAVRSCVWTLEPSTTNKRITSSKASNLSHKPTYVLLTCVCRAWSMAKMTAVLPDNIHRRTQQVCCSELAIAAVGRHQLNSTLAAQWCAGKFSKQHRHGTDRRTDRQTNGRGVMGKQLPNKWGLKRLNWSPSNSAYELQP